MSGVESDVFVFFNGVVNALVIELSLDEGLRQLLDRELADDIAVLDQACHAADFHSLSDPPSARKHTAVVFDSRRRRLVLFGGHDGDRVFGDLWEWDGDWRLVRQRRPEPRITNGTSCNATVLTC